MVHSMTAFSRQEQAADTGEISLEIRSVNHRYLDMNLRLPEELRACEPLIREQVADRVARGKLDITIRYQSPSAGDSLKLDQTLVERLAKTSHEVDKYIYNPAPISSLELMRWPGVIQSESVDAEQLRLNLKALLATALEDLLAMRQREGEKLKTALLQRCGGIEEIVARVEKLLPEIRQAWREKLVARLQEVKAELDENRLEQELVYLAQKTDVAEELDRLRMHLGEIRSVLDGDKPAGRRLDFLMQELNREANTLGSKSVHNETTRASIDLKVLIEQMREQVQNIE
jgi:uncharacterized protein (TIGR00255 family)